MKIEIDIDVEFGSKSQEEYGRASLDIMMEAWMVGLESKHKNNSVDYTIDTKLKK